MKKEDSGLLRYETTYGKSRTGYKGRLFAKNISLQTAPRSLREIAYDGLGVRDWDVESAYFTFALQAVEKLEINFAHPNFQMATVRKYLGDRRSAWDSLNSEKKTYSDSECKYIFTSVFCGSSMPKDFETNALLRGISREGRVCRWLSVCVIPDVYERLQQDPCKHWPEASAQSYFLAGIEARVMFAFYQFCKNICEGEGGPSLSHMSLQFDGADVAILPFPDDFRDSAERWILDTTGFRVNLVEKRHKFFGSNVVAGAVEVENAPPLPYDSILEKPGNSILLALCRLAGNSELAEVIQEAILTRGGTQPPTRSYRECLLIVGDGNLTYAENHQVTYGQKFLIHAEGRGGEPECVCAVVDKAGKVKISMRDKTYVHLLRGFKDILDTSIDKPILMKYSASATRSAEAPSNSAFEGNILLGMKAGA